MSTEHIPAGYPIDFAPGTSTWATKQAVAYESSDGKRRGDLQGRPVVVLTTRGRRTGEHRKSPVMRVTDGERYAVVASKGGSDENPDWYLNLRDDPEVWLQDGAARRRYRARTAAGAERSEWWARALEVWPAYAGYQTKTRREIPVVILDPVDG